jgi:glycine/D-amino acid oxidase-like deaminating enzyme
MNTKATPNYHQLGQAAFGHAVVIGSGIAGLTAAHILTHHFAHASWRCAGGHPEPDDDPNPRRGASQCSAALHAGRGDATGANAG